MFNLFKYELTVRWKSIIGWGLGLGAFTTLYIIVYPAYEEQMSTLAGISIYEMMGIDIASFEGFIASVAVQYLPLLLGIYMVLASTGILSGEEDNGTLELILASPLKRWQILSMKALALSIVMLFVTAVTTLVSVLALEFVRGVSDIELTVSAGQLIVAMMNTWFLTFAFTMMGLFFGAFTPNRRMAVIFTATVFIASYFMGIMFKMIELLNPLEPLSLFYYMDTTSTIFREGIDPADVLVLVVVGLVFFGLAIFSFERRNITVGNWPWQRARSVPSA